MMRYALNGMQWNAVGIHEVECVHGGLSSRISRLQGNAGDYMLNVRERR